MSSTQRDIPLKKSKNRGTDKVKFLLPAQKEGEGKEKKLAQISPIEPKRDLGCQTSKARVMTRGQRPQVFKGGTPLSWMEGGVCLDKDVL